MCTLNCRRRAWDHTPAATVPVLDQRFSVVWVIRPKPKPDGPDVIAGRGGYAIELGSRGNWTAAGHERGGDDAPALAIEVLGERLNVDRSRRRVDELIATDAPNVVGGDCRDPAHTLPGVRRIGDDDEAVRQQIAFFEGFQVQNRPRRPRRLRPTPLESQPPLCHDRVLRE